MKATLERPGVESDAGGSQPPARGFEKILVVRLGAMGDILHSLPAVATLRRAFPNARIDWVVEERWAELLCSRAELRSAPRSPQKPLVDTVHVVDTRAWRKSLLAKTTRTGAGAAVRTLRAARYDAAIDLQGSLKSAVLTRLSRAPVRYGFSRPAESPAGLFYTRRAAAQGAHIVEQNCSLALAASATAAEPVYEFPLPVDAEYDAWAGRELAQRGIGAFALLAPGAGWGAKCWPAERFAAVAVALRAAGLSSLVNHGPGEGDLARAVADAGGGAAQAISCSLGELIALTRRARLLVGGDTGPTHLAAALGVPVVGIYGPTNPARNGPFGSPTVVLRSERSQTSHARRAEAEPGLLEITTETVVAAAKQLLNQAGRSRG